jgi:hypothetical protein
MKKLIVPVGFSVPAYRLDEDFYLRSGSMISISRLNGKRKEPKRCGWYTWSENAVKPPAPRRMRAV